MKLKFLKTKISIVLGALCVLTTITCSAATSNLSLVSNSNKENEIKEFPTSDIVKNEVGFLPKYAENLGDGFKFDSFNYADTSCKDDEGNVIVKTKDASFFYKRDEIKNDQFLSMNAMDISNDRLNQYINSQLDKYPKNNITEYKGIKIYYINIHRKVVPSNYQKTEEDIKLINEGLLDISFGSYYQIEEHENQAVEWCENGIDYCIVNQDYNDVDKDAMVEMAKTVIDK